MAYAQLRAEFMQLFAVAVAGYLFGGGEGVNFIYANFSGG